MDIFDYNMDIFDYNKDIRKNAYVNWRTSCYDDSSNLSIMGDGYFLSAIILIKNCLNDNSDKKADIVIFPILHGVIHGTEIYLKAIYNILAKFLRENREFIGGHDIKQLYNEVQGIVRRFENKYSGKENIKYFIDEMASVENFINEIYNRTNNMDFVRYPIDSKKNNHFYVESKENVVVDLETLYTNVRSIHSSLNSIHGYYTDIYENFISIENEYYIDTDDYYF